MTKEERDTPICQYHEPWGDGLLAKFFLSVMIEANKRHYMNENILAKIDFYKLYL